MESEHFKDKELACLCCGVNNVAQVMVLRLERLRRLHKKPITLNSAYRCQKHNSEVGSKDTSSHPKGLAVDIKVHNSSDKFSIVWNALLAEFKRIGVANTFVHLDIDESKPANVMWNYK